MWDSLLPQTLLPGVSEDPFAAWTLGGGQTAEAEWPSSADGWDTQNAYPVNDYEMEEDETDTDTSSDDGQEDVGGPDIRHLGEEEAAETLYWAYRGAKRVWRRFTGKPVRKFRRFFKRSRFHQKGHKGKGRGFMYTRDDLYLFIKGKGKGKRAHTSGKGFGRRRNPKDRNGNVM